jgi:hypothetical protein
MVAPPCERLANVRGITGPTLNRIYSSAEKLQCKIRCDTRPSTYWHNDTYVMWPDDDVIPGRLFREGASAASGSSSSLSAERRRRAWRRSSACSAGPDRSTSPPCYTTTPATRPPPRHPRDHTRMKRTLPRERRRPDSGQSASRSARCMAASAVPECRGESAGGGERRERRAPQTSSLVVAKRRQVTSYRHAYLGNGMLKSGG